MLAVQSSQRRKRVVLQVSPALSSLALIAKLILFHAAIDLVCVAYDDAEELKIESREGRELGFDGKVSLKLTLHSAILTISTSTRQQAIHPAQVAIIQAAFSPSAKGNCRPEFPTNLNLP